MDGRIVSSRPSSSHMKRGAPIPPRDPKEIAVSVGFNSQVHIVLAGRGHFLCDTSVNTYQTFQARMFVGFCRTVGQDLLSAVLPDSNF